MLRGVVFDFDGVLVDSEYVHFEAIRDVLAREAGIAITHDEYLEHYLAHDDHTCFRRAFEIHGATATYERIADLVDMKWHAYDRRLPSVPFLPGARDLVLALHAAGVPLAIASGSRRNEIETLLRSQDLLAAFRGIVSADEVDNFKPHPEPYLRARAVIGAADSSEGAIAIEDSSTGMASARAAGLRVIGVVGSLPRAKLGLAHHIVESLVGLTLEDLASVARGNS